MNPSNAIRELEAIGTNHPKYPFVVEVLLTIPHPLLIGVNKD
jgi:hypothetical protein